MEKTIYLKKLTFSIAIIIGLLSPGNAGSGEAKGKSPLQEGMVFIPDSEPYPGSDSNQGYQICL